MAEGAFWLIAARLLVAAAPFGWWERSLGHRITPDEAMAALTPDQALRCRRIGRAVDQAAHHLRVHFKCLPRAMAAQWMLRRRGLPARLMIGILPPAERGTDDDLHAWVVAGTDTIVGELPFSYRPILALQCC